MSRQYGYVPLPAWIAHVKAQHGLATRLAPNRRGPRRQPCPPDKAIGILAALRHFGLLHDRR